MAMRNVLGGLVVAAAAIGISLASPAAAAPTNCQTVGAATLCGQGNVSGAGPSVNSATASTPAIGASGCTTAFGTYQRC
jgi:hypothetical protein